MSDVLFVRCLVMVLEEEILSTEQQIEGNHAF